MSKPQLRLAADYGASPLWTLDGRRMTQLQPRTTRRIASSDRHEACIDVIEANTRGPRDALLRAASWTSGIAGLASWS